MTLSSKLKPPFTGTLKAKLKKILKSSDQNDVRSSSPTEGDTSGTLKGRKHQPSPLSSNVWTTECISSSTDHHPTRPSIPPPFFDASSSTTSLIAASSITCHPPDSLASTSGSSSTPHRHQVHHHHSHHPSSSSCTTKTQSLMSSPSSLTSSPSSPNSTLVPSEASFPRTPILRPKHWTRNNKSGQSKSKSKSRPVLHPSTIINLPPPSPSYGSRQREYYSSTCSRVSELIANYEALALAAATTTTTTTTTTTPMIHVQRTGNNNSNSNNDIAFLGFRLGNLGNSSNSHTHTWSSPSSSSTLVPSSSSFSPASPVSPLMEKEKRREQEEQYHQRDQLRIRSLEKRIAELERECEEQKGTIEELREENEVFYTRLCEVSRENKKLKKRVRSVSQQPLFSLTDDSESDYGVEMHPDASTSHLDDASSSSYHHHQHQHYQYQHHHHLHPGPWNHQRDRVVSNNTTNTTNTTNSRDMETLRSDMLARPHGVFFDWCSESGSINMDASVSVVGGSDGGEEEEEKEQEEEGGGSYPPAELGDDDDDDAAASTV
ncbi:hypothetical protein K435DRAFT_966529 [Dendrothele bispora CBS 962.96]|uniref:Uncharacterized protein n=1 Tax=Dendrothele bispora (strain CBS 962.96) TaxID=1314807 RepID=A0A4S8LZV4_DENBC|nr:hypothetical protein K435DRAFT_966529 [Dendrothele bispora CBS 962.96]